MSDPQLRKDRTRGELTAVSSPGLEMTPIRGTREEARLPIVLGLVLMTVFIPTFLFTPEGKLNWLLEVGPGLLGMAALAISFPKFPFSRFVYFCVFLHILILTYGAFYSYAKTPLGDWAKETFHLSRNHYDRVGHFALGFFPAFIIQEVLLRKTAIRPGGWLFFLVVSVALAIGAFYEFIEWWAALLLDPEGGDRFLGSQGDIWDAQWDMLLALIGSALSLTILGKAHLASVENLFHRTRTAQHSTRGQQ